MTDPYYGITCLPSAAGADGAVTATVSLSGEFDLGACDDLRDVLHDVVSNDGTTHVVIDLTEVAFLDSETVNVLLQAFTQARAYGRDYRLTGAHGVVKRVLDILGLYDSAGAPPSLKLSRRTS